MPAVPVPNELEESAPVSPRAHSNGGKMLKVTPELVDQVEFDLDALSAEELTDLVAAERQIDLRAGAAVLAKVVTSCPWGAVEDPASYSRLPARLYYRLSRRLAQAVLAEQDAEKK